ncbi:hypothetical protein Tco_1452369 [Tanacetum coccineum]
MVVLYCQKFASEHWEFAIRMNRLVGEMHEACQDRIGFVQELESVAGVTVTTKTVVFLKEMMDKDGSREWHFCVVCAWCDVSLVCRFSIAMVVVTDLDGRDGLEGSIKGSWLCL